MRINNGVIVGAIGNVANCSTCRYNQCQSIYVNDAGVLIRFCRLCDVGAYKKLARCDGCDKEHVGSTGWFCMLHYMEWSAKYVE